MKFFYTFIIIVQIICLLGALNKEKATCVCDKTEPYKCECVKCGCANED